nr:MAG TPA: hypothetical protein [Caudoviricetes sp.]
MPILEKQPANLTLLTLVSIKITHQVARVFITTKEQKSGRHRFSSMENGSI